MAGWTSVVRKGSLLILALGLSTLGATHRWGDSAHAMGLITVGGGKVRHAVHLPSGKSRYTLILTATVLPPFQGDARLAFEGGPGMECEFRHSVPVIDLPIGRHPRLEGEILRDLRPGDRISIWVLLRPAPHDPAWPGGRYEITFHHTETGRPILEVPVVFGSGPGDDEQEHHH